MSRRPSLTLKRCAAWPGFGFGCARSGVSLPREQGQRMSNILGREPNSHAFFAEIAGKRLQ